MQRSPCRLRTAVRLEDGKMLCDRVGTPAFWAPEVFSGRYEFMVDVWALGVTVYLLMSAALPFEGQEQICAPIGADELAFVEPAGMSPMCTDFISMCLTKDPRRRPTGLEAAKHPWLSTKNQQEPIPTPSAAEVYQARLQNVALCFGGIATGVCVCWRDVCLEVFVKDGGQAARKEAAALQQRVASGQKVEELAADIQNHIQNRSADPKLARLKTS